MSPQNLLKNVCKPWAYVQDFTVFATWCTYLEIGITKISLEPIRRLFLHIAKCQNSSLFYNYFLPFYSWKLLIKDYIYLFHPLLQYWIYTLAWMVSPVLQNLSLQQLQEDWQKRDTRDSVRGRNQITRTASYCRIDHS